MAGLPLPESPVIIAGLLPESPVIMFDLRLPMTKLYA